MIENSFSWRPILLAGVASASLCWASAANAQAAATSGEVAAANSRNHVSNYVDLNGSVGVATNPRLQGGSGTSVTGLGRVSAYAVHSVVTDRDSLNLTGYIENQSYTNGLSSTQSFDLGVSARRVQSERLTVYGSADFSGDVGGQLYNRFVSVPTAPPMVDVGNPLPTILIIDPNAIGLSRRTFRVAAQGGFAYGFSARDSIDGSLGFQRAFVTGSGPSLNYTTVTGSLGWQRRISERSSAGARLVVSRGQYGSRGHSTVVSPQLTASTTLAEGWSANVAVGASISDENVLGIHERNVGLSLDAGLCKTSPNQSLCVSVSRGAQSAIGQGLSNVTSASGTYFRRLDAKNTVQAGVSVSQSSGSTRETQLLVAPKTSFYSANVSYNRKISPRLSTGVEAGARKFTQRGTNVPIATNATVFLRYRLGDLQ